MSTPYRDPPKCKQNASRGNNIKLYARLKAATVLCDRLIQAASVQLAIMNARAGVWLFFRQFGKSA